MYADFKSGFVLVLPSKQSRGCTFYPLIWPHLENPGFDSAKCDENRIKWRTVNNWRVWANYSWAFFVCLNLFAALGWYVTLFSKKFIGNQTLTHNPLTFYKLETLLDVPKANVMHTGEVFRSLGATLHKNLGTGDRRKKV